MEYRRQTEKSGENLGFDKRREGGRERAKSGTVVGGLGGRGGREVILKPGNIPGRLQ